MKKWRFLLVGALALSLAACGDEEVEKNDSKADTEVVENDKAKEVSQAGPVKFVDALGNEHEFETAPASIATLDPGVMDILVELGANITGRPQVSSELEEDVAAIQELGNPHEPSFEQIAALNPEVLIVPPSFAQFASTIEATGIKVVYESMQSIEDIQSTVTRYGELFGKQAEATKINDEITKAIGESVESTQDALIVYGAPGTYMAALNNSLYGDILAKAGGNNIAADLPGLDKYPSYATLSAEKIVEGNPKLIMLITHANPEMVQAGFEQQMSENPAWKNIDAVKNGQIVILPSVLFDNPGTQVIEAVDYMRDLLTKAEEAAK